MQGVAHHTQGHPAQGGGSNLYREGVKLSAAVDEGDEGAGYRSEPRRHGQDKKQAGVDGLADGVLKGPLLPSGGEPGQFGKYNIGDRQDKHPGDDQIQV